MNKIKLLLMGFASLLIFHQSTLFAQNDNLLELFTKHAYSYEWQTYYEDDLIRISTRYSDCSDPDNGIYPEFLLFKIENKSAQDIHTYWEWRFAYDGRTMSNEDTDEELVKLTLKSHESMEGSCIGIEHSKLRLYVQDKMDESMSALSGFSIAELNVFPL